MTGCDLANCDWGKIIEFRNLQRYVSTSQIDDGDFNHSQHVKKVIQNDGLRSMQ